MWLTEPWDVWWEALSRWRRPSTRPHDRELSLIALGEGSTSDPTFRAALVEAAARRQHRIGQMARARILATLDDQGLVDAVCAAALKDPSPRRLAFCAEHGLLPSEPADRAALLLLTGQHDLYRAADPDGSLLALGYDGASEQLRRRIQRSVVDAGDIASVRVLTTSGPGGRLRRMTSDDFRYLAGKLAGERDWDELWWVAQQLPLLDAVHAVGLIRAERDGWRPTGDAARTLFDQLAGADVGELRSASAALAEPETVYLHLNGRVVEAAFSPDGRCLAVATQATPDRWIAGSAEHRGGSGDISLYELPSGRLAHRYEGVDDVRSLRLLHRGDALLAARGWRVGPRIGVIERYAGGRVEKLYEAPDGSLVAPHLDGFVAVESLIDHEHLRFFTLEGDTIRTWRASLPVRRLAEHTCSFPRGVWGLPSGRVVVGGKDCLMVLDARADRLTQVLGHSQVPGAIGGLCVPDPDHLVTTGWGGVRRWRLDQGGPILEAGPQLAEAEPYDPVVIERSGQVAVISAFRRVTFLDATTLAQVDEERELGHGLSVRRQWSSPNGGCHAYLTEVSTDAKVHTVEVVVGVHSDAVMALADRQLANMTPADLARLGEELRTDLPGLAVRPFLELLHACLEHRFAAEVALGRGVPVASEHDIALGGEEP